MKGVQYSRAGGRWRHVEGEDETDGDRFEARTGEDAEKLSGDSEVEMRESGR